MTSLNPLNSVDSKSPTPRHAAPGRSKGARSASFNIEQAEDASTSSAGLLTGSNGELDPMRLMAASGGAAMLIGLAFFVGHAIEQDWLSPGVRFVLAALASALLTAAAWPVARRGHEAVAGALGGAGLGAWFAAWIVARHSHELISAGQTFVALGVGAAACLIIADGLRLRLMARLATVAACATPLLVPASVDHLGELMAYQLALVAGVMVLDVRRRWSELPTLALLATWALGARWMGQHGHELGQQLDGTTTPWFMVWCVALLTASAASAWRLVADGLLGESCGERSEAEEQAAVRERNHAVIRLVVAGLATWAAGAWISVDAPVRLAGGTLALALWHGSLAFVLRRSSGADRARASRVFGTLAWIQAFVAAPMAFEGALGGPLGSPGVAMWWLLMAGVALAARAATLGERAQDARQPWSPGWGWMAVPALGAMAWSLACHGSSWAVLTGGVAAAMPLLAAFGAPSWKGSNDGAQADPAGASPDKGPDVGLVVLGTLLWTVGAGVLIPGGTAAKLTCGVVPMAAALLYANWRPGEAARNLATWLSFGALAVAVALTAEFELLTRAVGMTNGTGSSLPDLHPLALVVPMGILGGLGLLVELRTPGRGPERTEGLGVAVTGALTLASLGLVAGVVQNLGASTEFAHFGYTLCGAGAGLGLLVAGLRVEVELWRTLGLAAIACAAVKVVAFDLATAGVMWRALSFVGLGAVLIGGAFAYSKARQREAGPTSN